MTTKLEMDFKSLQKLISRTGIPGEWRCKENHHQFRADDGAVFNWWKSTGTFTFQGPDTAAMAFKGALSKVISSGRIAEAIPLRKYEFFCVD